MHFPVTSEAAVELPETTWRVYLLGSLGFVLATDPELILEHIDDEDWIDREYGDSQPREIVCCRLSAIPQPQSPGSEFLRHPGSWDPDDEVRWELDDEGPQRALMLWRGAHGLAAALNAAGAAS